MMTMHQKQWRLKEGKQGQQSSYLSLLLSRRTEYVDTSDSSRKVDQINKKQINYFQARRSRPFNSTKRLPEAEKSHVNSTRNVALKVDTWRSGLGQTAFKNRTMPNEREDSDSGSADLKEQLRSTECSQTSCQTSQTSHPRQNRIQQYMLVKLIGRGKFGQVFLAVHKTTGFVGALKVIEKEEVYKLDGEGQAKMKKQMMNEVKIQAFLKHPNLVELYDFFYDEERIYIFMELGTDGHLYEMLANKGNFQEETTSIVTRQIAQGVKFMHKKGVIHRDIKLENIIFTCGMAKICDFGWSVYEPKDFRSTICGTPLYLSPEVLKGKKYTDKIDVWAIGTLCHEMATGKNPFGIMHQEQLTKIVKQEFRMSQGSVELRNFIGFALRKEPGSRPTAEVLLKHPFIESYGQIQTADELCEMAASL